MKRDDRWMAEPNISRRYPYGFDEQVIDRQDSVIVEEDNFHFHNFFIKLSEIDNRKSSHYRVLYAPWKVRFHNNHHQPAGSFDVDIHPHEGEFVTDFDIKQSEIQTIISAHSFLERLYRDGNERASSDAIVFMIETIFKEINDESYQSIEWILKVASVGRLAPEFLVGILRSAGSVRTKLSSWKRFLHEVREELKERGYDTDTALRGIPEE